jgi:Xaa-Pro aminopeptidase
MEIYDLVAGFSRPSKTYPEIAGFMKQQVRKRGLELAWEESVCPGVYTGPVEAQAHYTPMSRKVQRGHVLNMDFGVRVNGYCSDLQRTFYILEEGEQAPPAEVKKGFETIVRSIDEARKAIKPGLTGKDIDSVARKIVTDAGYDEFPHALGHQVGRFSHDGTALLGPPWEKYAEKPFQLLEENMVFTIEPRLTVEGRGVATIEEMVVVTAIGADWLSTPQQNLILIG